MANKRLDTPEAGFTLIELVIAMTLSVILTGMAAVAGYNYVRYSKNIELSATNSVTAQTVYTSLDNFINNANSSGETVTLTHSDGTDTLTYSTETYKLSDHLTSNMTDAHLVKDTNKTLTLTFTYEEIMYTYHFTCINNITGE